MAGGRLRAAFRAALVAGVVSAAPAAAAADTTTTTTTTAAVMGVAPAALPRVFVLDDEVRLRRQDGALASRWGQPLTPPSAEVSLIAFRGETVAFQIAVVAGDKPLQAIDVALSDLPGGASGPRARVALFREHYLSVRARSRNDRHPAESLGWQPAARPADDDMTGAIPDALLPMALDPTPAMPGPAVPAGLTGGFWIDIEIPAATAPGPYIATGQVTADGTVLARFTVRVQVLATPLPYRPTSVFAFYEADRLQARLGAGGAVERQLWQLLHAHQIDALAPLSSADDVRRLTAAYDGSLFTVQSGYIGPGAGTPPAVVALGAYGVLGAPRPESLRRVDEILAVFPPASTAVSPAAAVAAPAAPTDVFLYAIDEACTSPRAAEWKHALAGRATPRRLLLGQTCNDPPEQQPVDVVLVAAQAFRRALPAAARAVDRRAWIYNGMLPYTGALLLDADPRGLIANGWIAAAMAIERWFYWETIFWDDDNRGGHGPIDPFTTAESFHNRDGDSALGDGLLLYPGRQRGAFAARSLGHDGVLPSLRLKLIRRGIQDAGIIALAAREHPAETARIVAQALPAALDEARADRPAAWQTAPLRFSQARAALRRLVTRADPMAPDAIRAAFEDQADRRRQLIPLAPVPLRLRTRATPVILGTAVALLAVLLLAVTAVLQRRKRPPQG